MEVFLGFNDIRSKIIRSYFDLALLYVTRVSGEILFGHIYLMRYIL